MNIHFFAFSRIFSLNFFCKSWSFLDIKKNYLEIPPQNWQKSEYSFLRKYPFWNKFAFTTLPVLPPLWGNKERKIAIIQKFLYLKNSWASSCRPWTMCLQIIFNFSYMRLGLITDNLRLSLRVCNIAQIVQLCRNPLALRDDEHFDTCWLGQLFWK